MSSKCGFVDGWLTCDLDVGHVGLHEDHWIGGKPHREVESETTDL